MADHFFVHVLKNIHSITEEQLQFTEQSTDQQLYIAILAEKELLAVKKEKACYRMQRLNDDIAQAISQIRNFDIIFHVEALDASTTTIEEIDACWERVGCRYDAWRSCIEEVKAVYTNLHKQIRTHEAKISHLKKKITALSLRARSCDYVVKGLLTEYVVVENTFYKAYTINQSDCTIAEVEDCCAYLNKYWSHRFLLSDASLWAEKEICTPEDMGVKTSIKMDDTGMFIVICIHEEYSSLLVDRAYLLIKSNQV